MKEELMNHDFIKIICEDFNIDYKKKSICRFKKGSKIKASFNSIIVDKDGSEHPYMLDYNNRNNEKLKDFDYIYNITSKSLEDVIIECNLSLQKNKVKICEGGGWYSWGYRYYYKDFYSDF